MTAVDLAPGALTRSDGASDSAKNSEGKDEAPSFADALTALLEAARAGRISARAPGGRWLILRIEEALNGFNDIQEMGADDQPLPYPGGPATGMPAAPLPSDASFGSSSVRSSDARKGDVP